MTAHIWIKLRWAVLLLALFVPSLSWAGGLYLYEVGTPEVGLAGAGWAARAQDAATVFTNPAGMTRLERSELMLGIQPLYMNTAFNPNANTTASGIDGNASGLVPAGGTYYVHSLNPDLKLGVSVNGYFGAALEYGNQWVGRYYVEEVTLQAMSLQPAIAYRVRDWVSVGLGVSALYGIFKEEIAVNNNVPGMPDGKLELDTDDWTCQLNLGILLEPWNGTRFGLTYLSEADLAFSDQPEFSGLGPGMRSILGNRGLLNAELGLDMKMPQAVMFSAYHEISGYFAVMGNVGWQEWSKFGMVGVSVASDNPTSLTVDRKYKDTWHGALGCQLRITKPWLMSTGVAFDSTMVEEEDMTPDLPAGDTWRFGVGTQYRVSPKLSLGCAYELLWVGDLDMDVFRGPLAGRVSGTYENTAIHAMNVNLIWKF
ncbi:MAG: outer membrane protein transport protein [Pseudomonadota bacterium]